LSVSFVIRRVHLPSVCSNCAASARSSRASICGFFFFSYPASSAIYTLSLHDALPISRVHRSLWLALIPGASARHPAPRSAWNQRSEEHTSELQSLAYLVCRPLLEKKKRSPTRSCRPRLSSNRTLILTTVCSTSRLLTP